MSHPSWQPVAEYLAASPRSSGGFGDTKARSADFLTAHPGCGKYHESVLDVEVQVNVDVDVEFVIDF